MKKIIITIKADPLKRGRKVWGFNPATRVMKPKKGKGSYNRRKLWP